MELLGPCGGEACCKVQGDNWGLQNANLKHLTSLSKSKRPFQASKQEPELGRRYHDQNIWSGPQ